MIRSHGSSSLLRLSLALTIIVTPAIARAQIYHVVDLGTLGKGGTAPYSINKSGRIAGLSITDANERHSFRTGAYLPIHPADDLGVLTNGDFSVAECINDAGVAVGASSTTGGHLIAYKFDSSMHPLGTLGGLDSDAQGINASGYIVGSSTFPSGLTGAVLFYPNGQKGFLGTLGGSYSSAHAINATGRIIGGAKTLGGHTHAFLTSAYSVIHPNTDDLGTLGGDDSFAYGINANDVVVGYAELASGASHAVRWFGGIKLDLSTLGGVSSTAFGINTAGVIVGNSTNGDGIPHAFIWKSRPPMLDLNDFIGPSPWVLTGARAINDSGAIVGVGVINDEGHAFLLRPIQPASISITPNKIAGSLTATGKVTLNFATDVEIVVELKDKHPAADCPDRVTVPARSISATFPITTSVVTSNVVGSIGATYGGLTKSATLTVMPVSVKTLAFSPSSLVGGLAGKGTVTLECAAAPDDITVTLASANPSLVEVPGRVVVAAGATTVTFPVTTHQVAATTPVVVTATANGRFRTATLTLKQVTPKSLTLSPLKVHGGTSSTGLVTLVCPAGPGNVTVLLASSLATAVVPASIVVPMGATTASFPISTSHVGTTNTVSIKANAGGVTKSTTLTIVP